MKIAITGAMSVGKTTLAKDLSKVIGYKVLPEAARMVAKKGFKLDKEITEEAEYEILKVQTALEGQVGPWIADRCLIDLLAYIRILFKKNTKLVKAVRDELEKAKYDLIIYLEPEFPIEKDGLRSTDVEFQKQINRKIKNILRDSGFRVCKIKGSPISRLNQVLEILKK